MSAPVDPPVLVMLAAGLGTRFGGVKPLAPVGPAGEPLLVVGLRQAVDAGFTRVIVVTSATVRAGLTGELSVELIDQASVGPARVTPWGTVAAVLAGAAHVTGPVVVANGDDLYGVDALTAAHAAAITLGVDDAACITYPFAATVLDGHGVSRAVCALDGELITSVTEHRGLRRGDLDDDTPVSLNLWALGAGALSALRERFDRFVDAHPDADGTDELGLPMVLGELIAVGTIVAWAVPTRSRWLGVTWPDDVATVRAELLAPVAEAFGQPAPRRAEPLGHGHIHLTVAADDVVYQRINTDVFTDVEVLMHNAGLLATHLGSKSGGGDHPTTMAVTSPIAAVDGGWLWRDGRGGVWRASRRLADVMAIEVARSAEEAFEAARAFGAFDQLVADLDVDDVRDTIARFHDLGARRAQFEDALSADRVGRAGDITEVVEDARHLAGEVADALATARVGRLPPRVVHNDAKIANVLFASPPPDGGPKAVAVIDLDTAMAGTLLADLGELLRTGATRAAEDEAELARVTLDDAFLGAVVRGFLHGLGDAVSDAERTALPVAGAWMATENGLRFLADHLDGDRYFGADHVGHNLERARAQLRLGRLLLHAVPTIAELIEECR